MEQPQIFSSKAVWHVDYSDLNKFIAEKYEIKSFECHLESSNDTSHEYSGIDGEVASYEEDDIKEAIETGGVEHWGLYPVLNDMCRKGWIYPGNYIVRVSW